MFWLSPQRKAASPRPLHLARPRVEAVEPRTLLTAGHPLVIATLGDSLTDEYSFYGPASLASLGIPASLVSLAPANIATIGRSSAKNWVLNLAATRSAQVTFGVYSAASRPETRNQGFAEDWARSGATATGSNVSGNATTFSEQLHGFPSQSLPGLLTQTTASTGYKPKAVNVVTILVGSNDYVRALTKYADSLTQDDEFTAAKGRVNAVNASIETSIKTAVAQVRRTIPRARIVIVTPPDITIAPVVDSALAAGASLFPKLGRTVTASVRALNSDLTRFAGQQHVGLVNTQTLFARFLKTPTVDGVTVNVHSSGQDLTDGFVGDGFHPGTIVQGVLAQAITAKINTLYGKQVIKPLTNSDIVAYARATQPTIALSATTSTDPSAGSQLTLRAMVAPGVGSTSTPTGTVTFESITPASATTPATPGLVLGIAPVDASGVATLITTPNVLDLSPIYAVYSGDQATDARLSTGLGAPTG